MVPDMEGGGVPDFPVLTREGLSTSGVTRDHCAFHLHKPVTPASSH